MQVIEQSQLTLTPEDMATILEVYELTTIDTPHEKSPGIIVFKGPETAPIFSERNGRPRWGATPRLGNWKDFGGMFGEGPEVRRFRRIERMYVGSLRFPDGIPVGWWDCHRKRDRISEDYDLHDNRKDISEYEQRRLSALANGKTFMTDRQRDIDAAKKEAIRAGRNAPDQSQMVEMMSQVFGSILAGQKPTQVEVDAAHEIATAAAAEKIPEPEVAAPVVVTKDPAVKKTRKRRAPRKPKVTTPETP